MLDSDTSSTAVMVVECPAACWRYCEDRVAHMMFYTSIIWLVAFAIFDVFKKRVRRKRKEARTREQDQILHLTAQSTNDKT